MRILGLMSNKVGLWVFVFLGSICACTLGLKEPTPKRPNVLIILTDQQTNDCISWLGNPNLKTPAMDNLARTGIYFTQSYCTSPVCAPSRSSLITGRMPHETGVVWNSTNISPDYPSLAHIFSEAGYNTAWVGKWHLPESYPVKKQMDSVEGFRLVKFQTLQESWETGEATDGPIADAAVSFLREYRYEKPFLLAVSLHNPHDICHVPRNPDQYAKWKEIDVLPPLPPNFNNSWQEPEFLVQKRDMDHYGDELLRTKGYSEQDWKAYLYHYYRFAEMVDQEIGKIMTTLKNTGLDENTIVVLTSDHGDGAAAHRWAAKLSFYEEASTVPFIISWKGKIPQGRIDRKQLVSGIDMTPTLCDYAGLEKMPQFTGKSLRKVIDHPDSLLRGYLVTELADDKLDSARHGRMIRNMRYKYNVYSSGKNNEQLFDLWKDPGETQNLADEQNYRSLKSELRRQLGQWMVKTGDDFLLSERP